jgi:hypothetical protein
VKKILLALVAALATVAVAVPVASAGTDNGIKILTQCPSPGVVNLPTQLPGCQFNFFNGDGVREIYNPTSFTDVKTPFGETEHFGGTITNGTGKWVLYSTLSPLTKGQSCYSFATGRTTPDWLLTISPSGAYSLDCVFAR